MDLLLVAVVVVLDLPVVLVLQAVKDTVEVKVSIPGYNKDLLMLGILALMVVKEIEVVLLVDLDILLMVVVDLVRQVMEHLVVVEVMV